MELDDEEVGVENSIYKMSEAADWEKIDKRLTSTIFLTTTTM